MTKDGKRGKEGRDYVKYNLSNAECERKCTNARWCEALVYKIGSDKCKLWYYTDPYDKPPKYESKHKYECKWKPYDDDYHASSSDSDTPSSDSDTSSSHSDTSSSHSDTSSSDSNEDYYYDKPGTCGEWRDFGFVIADELYFEEFDGDCDNIFDFAEETTKKLLNRRFAGGKNGKERAYNECARDGVKRSVDKWYKKCLTPSECKEYGTLAADLVINDFCKIQSTNRVYEPKKIKRACKEEARLECRDSLYDTLKDLLIYGFSCDIIDDKLFKYHHYEDKLQENCRTVVLNLMET